MLDQQFAQVIEFMKLALERCDTIWEILAERAGFEPALGC